MKIISDNCRKGIRLYKGRFSLLLNILWWGLAPICGILIAGGIIYGTNITIYVGLSLAIVGGPVYAIFVTKNDKTKR